MEQARGMLRDDDQLELELGIAQTPRKAGLVTAATEEDGPFADASTTAFAEQTRVSAARVVGTPSRLLFEVPAGVYDGLGFTGVGDETFRDLVISRIVEPTSVLDTGRVLTDLGRQLASESTMRRTPGCAQGRGYRDVVATACFNHALTTEDVSLCLYDVTTLYFEAEKEDEGKDGLRKVGYSKECRVDPQVVVGLLVDRRGFPLEIGCFAGNKAETLTIVPIVKQFQAGTA